MASNQRTLADSEGGLSGPGWNFTTGGDEIAVLTGWHLTDDATDLAKWTIPETRLLPGEFLVVMASGKRSS